jgi:hypothetical protein
MWKWLMYLWRWLFPLHKKQTPYEFTYPLNSEAIETVENMNLKRVEEITPEGKIYMTYNEENNHFLYWSDKAIQYKYLDVVARKYVIVYDCKECYINMFRELINKKMPEKKEVNGPFVIYKSYKKVIDPRYVKEKTNQYKYLGKWVESVTNTYKKINFSDFKKGL